MNQTPFDLLMPFVFWEGKYEKSGKVAGRPAHVFHFPYPEWAKNINPKLSHIAMGIDDTYDAPLRVENYAAGYIPQSEYILQSFKKLQDRWIVKAIDFKDGKTRSNTRLKLLKPRLIWIWMPVFSLPQAYCGSSRFLERCINPFESSQDF